MSTLEAVLLSLLVLDAIALTVLVLIQQGKGADVGAAFGSGSSNTMFGSVGGAPFLTKLTAWFAIGFFIIAFALAYIAKERADAAGSLGIPTAGDAGIPTASVQPAADADMADGDVPLANDAEISDNDIPQAPADSSGSSGDVPEL
ncbi:MAG: preprotein translocase subunit SecG [Pseudomonadota bacterium]